MPRLRTSSRPHRPKSSTIRPPRRKPSPPPSPPLPSRPAGPDPRFAAKPRWCPRRRPGPGSVRPGPEPVALPPPGPRKASPGPAHAGRRCSPQPISGQMKYSLRLTPEQAVHWPPVEAVLHEISAQQAALVRSARDASGAFDTSTSMRVYFAAQPLLGTLREDQKAQIRARPAQWVLDRRVLSLMTGIDRSEALQSHLPYCLSPDRNRDLPSERDLTCVASNYERRFCMSKHPYRTTAVASVLAIAALGGVAQAKDAPLGSRQRVAAARAHFEGLCRPLEASGHSVPRTVLRERLGLSVPPVRRADQPGRVGGLSVAVAPRFAPPSVLYRPYTRPSRPASWHRTTFFWASVLTESEPHPTMRQAARLDR